jgi:hypothetical protein
MQFVLKMRQFGAYTTFLVFVLHQNGNPLLLGDELFLCASKLLHAESPSGAMTAASSTEVGSTAQTFGLFTQPWRNPQ